MINLQCSFELLNFSASKFLLSSSFSFCLKSARVMFVDKRKWRTGALISMTSLVPKVVLYKLFLACSWLNCSHEGLGIANPVTRILLAWTALAALAAFFIFHENIHLMDVFTLSQGKQDTIAKSNLRRITLTPVWGINSFALHALYCHQISSSKFNERVLKPGMPWE